MPAVQNKAQRKLNIVFGCSVFPQNDNFLSTIGRYFAFKHFAHRYSFAEIFRSASFLQIFGPAGGKNYKFWLPLSKDSRTRNANRVASSHVCHFAIRRKLFVAQAGPDQRLNPVALHGLASLDKPCGLPLGPFSNGNLFYAMP